MTQEQDKRTGPAERSADLEEVCSGLCDDDDDDDENNDEDYEDDKGSHKKQIFYGQADRNFFNR